MLNAWDWDRHLFYPAVSDTVTVQHREGAEGMGVEEQPGLVVWLTALSASGHPGHCCPKNTVFSFPVHMLGHLEGFNSSVIFAFVLDRKVYYILEKYQKLKYAMFIFLHNRGTVL